MLSKESRGTARDVAVGESRLRVLLRPADPVPPSARLRSVPSPPSPPSPPGPPPSFGAPHRTEEARERDDHDHRGTVLPPEEGDGESFARSTPYENPPPLPASAPEAWPRTMPGRALARMDPGVPGLRVLVAVGLLAAVVTGVVVWRSRAVAEPVAPPLPAAAGLEPVPGAGPAATPNPGTGPGSVPGPARGPDGEKADGQGATAYTPGAGETGGPSSGPAARLVVYVTGKVRRPGVFVLPTGARAADAIQAAGGVRRGASPGGVNLARHVVDGEQITVGSPAQSGEAAGPDAPPGGMGTPGGAVVNLNTATAAQLDALPGVGGVIAQRIVDYRDARGGFQSVEQLKDVPGIGERKFAELRDKVTV
ncbi:ComEA family DNA-binding protein [Microbispora sp. NBC_01389]|uniref:ComEA family DNA-binding protein n=1 Tax=Microbispora sp. NBC_01389 TaxID=2903584 RepID=UPI003247B835